ncbi:MAG: trypsin-like serine protease|nr:trypsin-like serine protease [Candidatus Buchananbacteria bacterium]
MFFQEPKKNAKNFKQRFLVLVIVLSLILGALAGAATSFLILQNLDQLVGDNGLKIEKVKTEKISLLEEESATIEVVKTASPSVVSIIVSKELKDIYSSTGPLDDHFNLGPFGFRFEQPQPQLPENGEQKQEIGGGTGFIISEDGLILTNKHVVIDEEADYTILTNEGEKFEAEVLARDPINDLAVIKIDADNLQPLALGDSDNIEIGQTVIAIGNTLSEFRNTVTRGVISGIGRRVEAGGNLGYSEVIEEAIQTDAAINPGNSGGPLLNLQGQVIGISTAISRAGQSVGFAIPINEAKQVITSIEKYGKIVRPFLGVRYVMINKKMAEINDLSVDYGALIVQGNNSDVLAVVPGSPADKAGLAANDIILQVNEQKIDQNHSLGRVLARYAPGDEVELKVFHDGEEKTVKVQLVEREIE